MLLGGKLLPRANQTLRQKPFELRLNALTKHLNPKNTNKTTVDPISFFVGVANLKRGLYTDKDKIKFNDFNLFTILGFPHLRLEQIHSNILAWLLNPKESHYLGDKFLNLFLLRYLNLEFRRDLKVRVLREVQEQSDRPDIIIDSKEFTVLVENKIDSTEGKNQSWRYYHRWNQKETAAKQIYFVWVTKDGRMPECQHYFPVSYYDIADCLSELQFRKDGTVFINHFVEHININLGRT